MIVENLMGVGSFGVRLADDCPHAVRALVGGFASIVVTPVWHPDPALTRSELLDFARYRGVIEGWSDDRRSIVGAGMLAWLGDAGGYGAGYRYATPVTARTWEQWLDQLVTDASTNGLTKGTTASLPATTYPANSSTEVPASARELLELVAANVGVEYRANPDGTIDAGGLGSSLFRTTPEVVLTRDTPGTDVDLRSFPALGWNVEKSYDEYLNYVTVKGNGVVGSASNLGSEARYDAGGSTAVRRKVLVSNSDPASTGDADTVAQGILDAHEVTRTHVATTIDAYDPRAYLEPGDTVYAWDLVDRLTDSSNGVHFLGELIHPVELRLYGIRWPLLSGMGVYLLANDATDDPQVVDLTDWVAWDSPGVELDVGAPGRRLLG